MSLFSSLWPPTRGAAQLPGDDPAARWRKRRRKILVAAALGLLPGIAGVVCSHLPLTETLELTSLDLFFLTRGVQKPPPEICIVALDDASYQERGVPDNVVWPRTLHAELIRTLKAHGASVIAFDILFTTADAASDADQELADAIVQAGNVVLASKTEVRSDGRARVVQVQDPAPVFAAGAVIAEAALPAPDRQGVVRRAWVRHEGRPGLGAAAVELARGASAVKAEQGQRLIDYYGPAGTIPTVSYYQALKPGTFLPADFFRGKIVFVGRAQAVGIAAAEKDTFQTPFRGGSAPPTFGVEIHATVAGNLLEGRRIELLPGLVEDGLLLLLPFIAAIAFIFFRPLMGAVLLVLLEVGVWMWGHYAFTYDSTWIPVMIPSIVELPTAYLASVVWYYLTTVREREKIRRAFSFYLAPEMIRQIMADTSSLNLGGKEISGTALFTDIAGFTSIAESLPPQECAAMLNRYFSRINQDIFDQQGTLIKFIGDAAFAIWGAPLTLENHAHLACSAAVTIAQDRTDGPEGPEGPDGQQADDRRLVTRIGIYSGNMLVGNLGSEQRFDYTAIGDAVNVAARLEGVNKYFGTMALAGGSTIAMTGGAFVTRSLGPVRVAGKAVPVEIFEVLGRQGDDTVPDVRGLARFAEAHRDFVARRFDEALAGFREVEELCGGHDGPSGFFADECRRHSATPPDDDWDGTISFVTK